MAYHSIMTRPFALLFALLLACTAPPAAAWGVMGHRTVGELAARELSPAARAEVARLLAGEPEPTLAGVSAWADQLRAQDPTLGRRSAPWHYVNLGEDGCTYDAARDCPGGDCVVEAIRTQAAILADRTQPDDARRQALKFVVHFVGDAHQPLHAGHAHDKGGNTVQVRVPSASGERGSNLHSWWDSGMLEQAGLDEAALVARLQGLPLAVETLRPALPPPAAEWARHACALAVSPGFYPADARLPEGYAGRWLPVAHEQLRRAGSRLAQVIDAALAP